MLFDPPLQIPQPVRVLSHADHPNSERQDGIKTPPPVSRSEPVDELRNILFHKPRIPIRRFDSRDWSSKASALTATTVSQLVQQKEEDQEEDQETDQEEIEEKEDEETREKEMQEAIDEEMEQQESQLFQPLTFSFDLPQCEPSLSPGPPDRCGNPITRNTGFLSDYNGSLVARVQPKPTCDVHGAELGLLDLSPPRTYQLHRLRV